MGKNFSCNNLGQRRKSDTYSTPYSLTHALLGEETFHKDILEPACGEGAIVKVLKGRGYRVTSYDKETDFLKETKQYPSIISNPPYSLAFEFIQKAKEIATEEFAFLLPLSYLHGQTRYEKVWTDMDYQLARVLVFTRYPMLGAPLRDDGKFPTGMMAYAWYIWKKKYDGYPTLHWLDIQDYVLSKADVFGPKESGHQWEYA